MSFESANILQCEEYEARVMLIECLLEALECRVGQLLDPAVQVFHSCSELHFEAEALAMRKAVQIVLNYAQLFNQHRSLSNGVVN